MTTMKPRRWVVLLAMSLIAVPGAADEKPRQPRREKLEEEVWLEGFRDGIEHWRKKQDGEDYPRLKPSQVREIADNLLLYQRANGGWPKDLDILRILTEDERAEIRAAKSREDTSFDNRNTYTQVEYLARAFGRTHDEQYREGSLRGLEFVLAAMYPNGGWPHSFPSKRDYYPRITIVDDVMVGVLNLLRQVSEKQAHFHFVDGSMQRRCQEAYARGNACLLDLQVKVDGELTGWAAQYDEETLEPCQGRSFELPALVSMETVHVLRYLMTIEPPTPAIIASVDGGASWLERSKIHGIRLERVPAPTVRYPNHVSRDDLVVVEDPSAPPLWARFYDLKTNVPFMANRDGTKVYKLADVHRERRTNYSWYGGYATSFLQKEYPAWRQRWDGIARETP